MSEEASARPPAASEMDTGATAIAGRKRDLTVLAVAAVVLALSTLAAKATLSDAEVAVFRAINGLPQRLHSVVWPVMQYGTFITIPALAAVALLFRRFRMAAAMVLAGVGVYLLALAIKSFVERGRPAALLPGVEGREVFGEGSLGYPSGHAAVAAALTVVVAAHLSRRWAIGALVLGFAVLFGRMYVGAHLPLDVVGGAALGVVAGSIVNLLIRPSPSPSPGSESGRTAPLVREERHPQALVAAEEDTPRDGGRTEAVAHRVERRIERRSARSRRTATRAGSPRRSWRFVKLMPISVMPRSRIIGRAAASRVLAAASDRLGIGRRLGQRVRPRRPGEVVEPQTEHDRATDAMRRPQPSRQAIDQRDQVGVERLRRSRPAAERPLGSDRAASSADVDPPWIAVVGERPEMTSGGGTDDPRQRGFAEPGDLRHRGDRAVVELPCGDRSHAPQALDRQRVEERQLAVDGHDQQAVRLGDPARDLREELGPGHADGDRQTDPLEHVVDAGASAISVGVPEIRRKPPTSRNASSIESPSTNGVVSLNTSNIALLAVL